MLHRSQFLSMLDLGEMSWSWPTQCDASVYESVREQHRLFTRKLDKDGLVSKFACQNKTPINNMGVVGFHMLLYVLICHGAHVDVKIKFFHSTMWSQGSGLAARAFTPWATLPLTLIFFLSHHTFLSFIAFYNCGIFTLWHESLTWCWKIYFSISARKSLEIYILTHTN